MMKVIRREDAEKGVMYHADFFRPTPASFIDYELPDSEIPVCNVNETDVENWDQIECWRYAPVTGELKKMENEFKPYGPKDFIPFDSIVDVRYKGVAQPATAVKANAVHWSAVIEWRYSDQQTVEPSIKEPLLPGFAAFNRGEWIKFIPGDAAYWNHGDKLDIRYLTGDIHNYVSTEGINWDTVAKYRKSMGEPVEAVKPTPPLPHVAPPRQAAPRLVPDGYKWVNHNHNLNYLNYVEAGWTVDELIDIHFLQPVELVKPVQSAFDNGGNPYPSEPTAKFEHPTFSLEPFSTINGEPASKALTTQQGTEVDPNSRYYDAGGIETIEIIKAKLTPEQLKGYLLGNVIKYSSRLNFKGTAVRDAEKLKFYANWLEQLK